MPLSVAATHGNRISEEAMATLPPYEDGDFIHRGAAVWEGKFCKHRLRQCAGAAGEKYISNTVYRSEHVRTHRDSRTVPSQIGRVHDLIKIILVQY